MVFNRLCDPARKLGCLQWLETIAIPSMSDTVTHQHLIRAMDALIDSADTVEEALARQIRLLVDHSIVGFFASPWNFSAFMNILAASKVFAENVKVLRI